LQKQTWYQYPERYIDLFADNEDWQPQPLTLAGSPAEEVVDNIDELDAYYEDLEKQRMVSGGEVFGYLDESNGAWI
jgi:hypothetical protein